MLVVVTVAVGGLAVAQLRTVFGSNPVIVTPKGSDSAADFNPKVVTYEVFGSGAAADFVIEHDAAADHRPVDADRRTAAADVERTGRAGRVAGTHEWVVRGLPYIIVYQIGAAESDEVLILGVFHGARDRERQ